MATKKRKAGANLNWKKVPISGDVFFQSTSDGFLSLEEIDPEEYFKTNPKPIKVLTINSEENAPEVTDVSHDTQKKKKKNKKKAKKPKVEANDEEEVTPAKEEEKAEVDDVKMENEDQANQNNEKKNKKKKKKEKKPKID